MTCLGNGELLCVRLVQVDMVRSCRWGERKTRRRRYPDPPTPAVTQSLSFGAFLMRSAVRYPGWKGVVIRISV